MLRTPTFLAPAVLASAATVLVAAPPQFWRTSTQAGFATGEVENLSIDAGGRLVLGPSARVIAEPAEPFIWTLVAGGDGRVWAGTGNDGLVLGVSPEGTVTTIFDAAELQVHALAPAPGGGMYVGTSPDGAVLRVADDGTATPFFDPEDQYIWALSVGPDGHVFVATGPSGLIYRVTPEGEGAEFYDTRTTNVTALGWDAEGRLLAGTQSPGRLFRIEDTSRGFVLLDSAYDEIRAIRVDDEGTIYTAALNAQPAAARPAEEPEPSEAAPPAPVATVSTEIRITAIGEPSTPAADRARPAESRAAKGAVFRIGPSGLPDRIWESTQDAPHALAWQSDGALLIATGDAGRIYRLDTDAARPALLTRLAAEQVTAFAPTPEGGLWLATSNPSGLYELTSGRASEGVYLSEVRDARIGATWGAIRWQAATPEDATVSIVTRSGNTPTPDETWSAWSEPYASATGSTVASPPARYLQWRATLAGERASPALTAVTVAYLQRNVRPVVSSITVHPPGTVFQRPFSTGDLEVAGFAGPDGDGRPRTGLPDDLEANGPALGRRTFVKGLQTFAWSADDENADRLAYDVWYRRQGDTTWRPLATGSLSPIYTWDTTAVPDGTYVIRVTASDAPTNAPDTALEGDRESTPFEVDNSSPSISIGTFTPADGETVVAVEVEDSHSPIELLEYSTDASTWRVAYPVDGIGDSRTESYQIGLVSDAERIFVRATDSLGNVSTAAGSRE